MKTATTLLKVSLFAAICAMGCFTQAQAQTIPPIPPITGQTITINGQSFLLTYSNGTYVATSAGPNGSISVATPTSAADAINQIQQLVSQNNPANADYYTNNEIAARIGAIYEQNSGQTAALISVTKWGWISSQPIGFEAALLQGNQNGSSGTAGAYGAIDYRKIIGDVAAVGGIGAGYDNYNKLAFGLVKAGVEYRQNAHLGEWVDLNYAFEPAGNASRGFGFAAGVTYKF